MKVYMLFLLLPLTGLAQSTPNCRDLQNMVKEMEKTMASKKADNCGELNGQSLLSSEVREIESTIDKYKCSSLLNIEAQINHLEAEISTLEGFKKLKADIRAEKERTTSARLQIAREAGSNFANGVRTAQALDLLVREGNDPQFLTNLHNALASLPENQKNDPQIFLNKVRFLCGGTQNPRAPLGPCHQSFRPNEAAIREINHLLNQGVPSAEQIASWRSSLAIKKIDGSDYSFSQMYDDLSAALPKIAAGEVTLTRNELRVMKSLPDFRDDNSNLRFLAALQEGKEDAKTQLLMEQFKFLNEDLKARQQHQIKARVSLAWSSFGASLSGLSSEQQSACRSSHSTYEAASTCLGALEGHIHRLPPSSTERNALLNLKETLRSSQNHLTKIESVQRQCLNAEVLRAAKASGELTEQCLAELPDLSSSITQKQNELLALSRLRDKVTLENERLLTFRNYAISKLTNNNCVSAVSSSIDCDEEYLPGFKEAMVLSSEMMGIALVHRPLAQEPDISSFCETEGQGHYEGALCRFLRPQTDPQVTPPRFVLPEGPTDARTEVENRRNPVREAWIQGGSNLAVTLGQMLWPRPQHNMYGAQMNPYAYGYFNGGPAVPLLSVSDSLLYSNGYMLSPMSRSFTSTYPMAQSAYFQR